MAAVARESGAATIHPGAVHLPFRGKVLRRRRRAGEIRRASACRKREGHTDSGIVLQEYGLEQENPVITILPGSRWGEIAHHVPVLVEALAGLGRTLPGSFGVVVAVAPGLDSEKLKGLFPAQLHVKFIQQDTYNALAVADLAIVSSGTATVETALLGAPMIVVYRLSPLTARLAKPLVRTKFFSMVI